MMTAALAVVAASALAGAAVGEAQTAAQDSVGGSARQCLPADCQSLSFISLSADARSGPSGASPTGTMVWDELEPFIGGLHLHSETQVSCLSVSGNVAIVGVGGTRAFTGSFGTFSGISIAGLIRVTDRGGPGSGLDTFEFDVLQNPFPPFPPVPPPLPPPTDCSTFPAGTPVYTNQQGDLVVTHAPSLPTTTQQCRNGGWRTYDVFKNQGDCVSFVRHQARQKCIFERVSHGITAFRAKYGLGPNHSHAMRHCVRLYTGF